MFALSSCIQGGQQEESSSTSVLVRLFVLSCLSENQELRIMAAKPKLYYFDGRGRMESVRWLLAAAGVEYEEVLFQTAEDFKNLIKSGKLMYDQVPMVEMDGMSIVQTRAILKYIATKYNLYGKDLKERAIIDMYVEGMRDLNDMIMFFPFSLPEEKQKILNYILERATQRFFPVYEKALKDHGKNYLVGNQLSWADVQLLEVILMVEELKSDILSAFPKLQEFKARVSKLPNIQKFLQPGSPRKPQEDETTVEVVKKIFKLDEDLFLQHM
ncbi:glutathione S-transferase-like isoform X1 [Vombatus ursinus]|uniref:glutathione transferase n=2 Tax=Vombatus ursinus TaxID=29139 RepID=A0A4X2KJT5_VOMUR|nr:glutathione S-transferase-like isoform X1 [Vombatus ursinus]